MSDGGSERSESVPADAGERSLEADLRPSSREIHVPLLGARKKAHELANQVVLLEQALDRVEGLSLLDVERRRDALQAEIDDQRATLERERVEREQARERELEETRAAVRLERAQLEAGREQLAAELAALKTEVVETREIALLQEAGVYEYRHPLTSAVAYQADLGKLRERIKAMARADGNAVTGSTTWTVNGSTAQGRRMVRDFSKLLLRAYNAEADNLVRGLKPYRVDAAIERLNKVAVTIERLGSTMDIHVSKDYQALRISELELTSDYLAKVEADKEHDREERERLREERKAQQEIERERERLRKEHEHYTNALETVQANGDAEAADRLQAELAEIERAIAHIDYRAANIRAGYVYVISNLGSFGPDVVKIGMTRRLAPTERVRELGDASVPFRYDTHALFFSDDAVGIETTLHKRLADLRVNRINNRREFFYATPEQVRRELQDLAGDLLNYEETPEALEYRQSQTLRNTIPETPSAAPENDFAPSSQEA